MSQFLGLVQTWSPTIPRIGLCHVSQASSIHRMGLCAFAHNDRVPLRSGLAVTFPKSRSCLSGVKLCLHWVGMAKCLFAWDRGNSPICDYRSSILAPTLSPGRCKILDSAFLLIMANLVKTSYRLNRYWIIHLHFPLSFTQHRYEIEPPTRCF